MKHKSSLQLATLIFCLSASADSKTAQKGLPASVILQSNEITVRLDGMKFCFMNRIEWKGRLMAIDSPYAHYGTVFMIKGKKGFVGSGHMETGEKEIVESLSITGDGKKIEPMDGASFKASVFHVRKQSRMNVFHLTYDLYIDGNIITERSETTSDADCDISLMYHFMHPWSTDFSELLTVMPDGKEVSHRFVSDEKFPVYGPCPIAVFYNSKTGDGVVTVTLHGNGISRPVRYIWDRKTYRKDYQGDFMRTTFPAGHKAVYCVKTAFFRQSDPAKWKAEALSLADKLIKSSLK